MKALLDRSIKYSIYIFLLVKRNSDNQEYAMKKVRMGNLKLRERENALNEIRILASI